MCFSASRRSRQVARGAASSQRSGLLWGARQKPRPSALPWSGWERRLLDDARSEHRSGRRVRARPRERGTRLSFDDAVGSRSVRRLAACSKDLRDWIALLEREGELVRVSAEVDPDLEITEIVDRTVKAGGPALLFENPKGAEHPLLINQFGTERRMALAFGVAQLDDVARQGRRRARDAAAARACSRRSAACRSSSPSPTRGRRRCARARARRSSSRATTST